MDELAEFAERACAALGLPSGSAPTDLVLDLAKEVAHGVVRPAAPLGAYLLGLAVGQGADPREAANTLIDLARPAQEN